jgi:hypothetical protein
MSFSHRDHRLRRELRRLYLGFAVAVGVLAAAALLVPESTLRILAVVGLVAVAGAYVVAVDRLTDTYRRDLAAARAGTPISGAVRAEIFHEIGFERDREDDWEPSPHHRSPVVPKEPGAPDREPTSPERSGPPSGGS